MLDRTLIRKNPQMIKKNIVARGVRVDLDALLVLEGAYRELAARVEKLRSERNELSRSRPATGARAKTVEQAKKIKQELAHIEPQLVEMEKKLKETLETLPNISHETVPPGEDVDDNVVVKEVGKPPTFDFQPKPHELVAATHKNIDEKRAARVSGTRFYYLMGDLVLLERALLEYALRKATNKGFIPVQPPLLVRERAMWNTGHFPADKNEVYSVNPGEDNLYLVGTSEVPLVSLHQDEALSPTSLPLRYTACTPCFRREAGSYGKDQHGIFRVHQFNKVELVMLTDPDDSWEWLEHILVIEEELMQDLEVPYRVVNVCSGDLGGGAAAKRYDIEAWFPAQRAYREVTSASNTTDFQTRRAGIFVNKKNGRCLAHALNGTMVTDRALLAILENNQLKDGGVIVPKALHPLFGKDALSPQ